MNTPFSVLRFLAIIAFLGAISSGIFIQTVKAQKLSNADTTAQISEIEIKGTSDLESSQIMFLIESQVGEPLDRKMIRRDIHLIFQMNIFEDDYSPQAYSENFKILFNKMSGQITEFSLGDSILSLIHI